MGLCVLSTCVASGGSSLSQLNGRLFNGDVEELLSKLRDQVEPLVPCDKTLLETVSKKTCGVVGFRERWRVVCRGKRGRGGREGEGREEDGVSRALRLDHTSIMYSS